MNPLQRKKKEVEYHQVLAAKMDREYKLLELQEQIERVKENIEQQQARMDELKAELGDSFNG